MPRYVPCRVPHLTAELALLFPEGPARDDFWALGRVVEALFHHYAGGQGRLVDGLYAPFDPDRDAVPVARPLPEAPVGRLLERLEHLLQRANFSRVALTELMSASDREVLIQLNIDPDLDAVEELRVFTRGAGAKAVTLRPARKLFRLVEREVPTYRRVAIAVRTRDQPWVLLKLFKDVPRADLELLLPTVRVKMKLLDKLKLSGSGGAAAISAWKMLRLAYLYTPGVAKLLAVPFKALLLPLFVLVGGIYGGKTVLDYSKIRASYVTVLAEHLYAITMASNSSVVARLASLAGEEETKEVLIAYALLARAGQEGLTPARLAAEAEAFLWDRYRARIRFDVGDALAKLDELDLVRHEGERRIAHPLPAALRKLDVAWDEVFEAPPRARERLARRRRA